MIFARSLLLTTRLFRTRCKPPLAPSEGLHDIACPSGLSWEVTGPDEYICLRGPLPFGWVKVDVVASSGRSSKLRLHVEVPGARPFDNIFDIGAVDVQETSLSAFVYIDRRAASVRLLPQGDSQRLVIKQLTLTRVSKVEIVMITLSRFLEAQDAPLRLLFGLCTSWLAAMRTGGLREMKNRFNRQVASQIKTSERYELWVRENTLRQEQLEELKERVEALACKPSFSLLMRVTDGDPFRLRSAIDSVLNQVFAGWELYLVVFATAGTVEKEIGDVAAADPRVKIIRCGPEAVQDQGALLPPGDFLSIIQEEVKLAPTALAELALYLEAHPETDMIYTDEDRVDDQGRRIDPHFKPDWSPDYFESFYYTSSVNCFRRSIVEKTGWSMGAEHETDYEYDLSLRFMELTPRIAHIPKILCHRPVKDHPGSNGGGNRMASLKSHLERTNTPGTITRGAVSGTFDIRYHISGNPLVSIVIPAGGRKAVIRGREVDLLSNCLKSIYENSTYKNYEIIVVEDGNLEESVLGFLKEKGVTLVPFRSTFNFSAKINLGCRHAKGDHFLLFNDDTETISPDWLSEMVQFSQREPIGAVGAKLFFEDGTIQHAGVTLSGEGFPTHLYRGFPGSFPGYFHNLVVNRNCLAVTGACLMTRREVFEKLGGLNEEMPVNYNDIDYCLKVHEAGYRTVLAARAELFHYESKSRPPRVRQKEMTCYARSWHSRIKRDPYYNVNLDPDPPLFEVKVDPERLLKPL